MSHLAPVSRREFIRKLQTLGFEGPFVGGRHQFLVRGDLRLILPNPHREDITPALLARLLRQAGITREEWQAD